MSADLIKNPVIIIGCPRSGTTMLFNILTQSNELYSLYRESWNVIRGGYFNGMLDPDAKDDVLSADDLSDELKDYIRKGFHEYTVNKENLAFWTAQKFRMKAISSHLPIPNPFAGLVTQANALIKNKRNQNYRILEKTPRNCFRVDFMNKLFPDAQFIFISREGKSNISSLIEGWKRQAKHIKHKRFPRLNTEFTFNNFDFQKWEYVLPPEWEEFNGKSLEETCAHQWIQSNRYALDSLTKLDQDRVIKVSYEDMCEKPGEIVKNICDFVNIKYEDKLQEYAEKPPVVSTALFEKPKNDKWKKNQAAIEKVLPMIEPMMNELGYREDLNSPVT